MLIANADDVLLENLGTFTHIGLTNLLTENFSFDFEIRIKKLEKKNEKEGTEDFSH